MALTPSLPQWVKTQLQSRGIKSPALLEAMAKIPRERFVPEEMVPLAYDDRPLPIGHGQTISQPYIVAFMTEAAQVTKSSKVLDVGTGCGYQAAVLAEICQKVYTIEVVENLAKDAKKRLKDLGYTNVYTKCGDGNLGWPENAPFDAIVVAAATKKVPLHLIEQLRVGGHLIIPLERPPFGQILVKVTKNTTDGNYSTQDLLAVRFVPLIGPA